MVRQSRRYRNCVLMRDLRSSLQSHAALVSNNLQTLAQQLAQQQPLLSSLIAHPLPTFPNHQTHIVEQMLRTKLEPDVKEWVEKGEEMTVQGQSLCILSDRQRDELWQWAPSAANLEARKQKWGADYTLAEQEKGVEWVQTGLTRQLLEPADGAGDEEGEYDEVTDDEAVGDEDEDEDKMDVVEIRSNPGGGGMVQTAVSSPPATPQMPLATIHRFTITGKLGQ